jgi:hypothetical protein
LLKKLACCIKGLRIRAFLRFLAAQWAWWLVVVSWVLPILGFGQGEAVVRLQQADSLAGLGRLDEAHNQLRGVLQDTWDSRQDVVFIKALLLQAELRRRQFPAIAPDSLLREPYQWLARAEVPLRGVLASLLAGVLENYYVAELAVLRQKRGLLPREAVLPTLPYTTHGVRVAGLHRKIQELYSLSVRELAAYRSVSAAKYRQLLTTNRKFASLAPKLADVLVYRAADFWLREPDQWQAERIFANRHKAAFFLPATGFATYSFELADTQSNLYRLARAYQQLTLLHSTDEKPHAAIAVDLARVEAFRVGLAPFYPTDSLAERGIRSVYARASGYSIGLMYQALAQLRYEKALTYRSDSTTRRYKTWMVEAKSFCDSCLRLAPKTPIVPVCGRLRRLIVRKELEAWLRTSALPGQAFRLTVRHRNVPGLYIKWVKPPPDSCLNLARTTWQPDLLAFANRQTQGVTNEKFRIVNPPDRLPYTTEVVLNGRQEEGLYLLVVSTNEAFSTKSGPVLVYKVWVSRYQVLEAHGYKNQLAYAVVSAENGRPVTDVEAVFYGTRPNPKLGTLEPERLVSARANDQNLYVFEPYDNQSTYVQAGFYHQGRLVQVAENMDFSVSAKPLNIPTDQKLWVLPERTLVRVGETIRIQVVGLMRFSTGSSWQPNPNQAVRLEITPSSNKLEAFIHLKTDARGQAVCYWKAPTRPGRYTLLYPGGSTTLQVQVVLPPRRDLEIRLDPVPAKPNQQRQCIATLKREAGAVLANTAIQLVVEVVITRAGAGTPITVLPLLSRQANTNANGVLTLPFYTFVHDKYPINEGFAYSYRVSATDVEEPAYEAHTVLDLLPLGYVQRLEVPRIARSDQPLQLTLHPAGLPDAPTGTVSLQRLNPPYFWVQDDGRPRPDSARYSKQTFIEQCRGEPYWQDGYPEEWPVEKTWLTKAGRGRKWSLPLPPDLPQGEYRVLYKPDAKGAPVVQAHVSVVSPGQPIKSNQALVVLQAETPVLTPGQDCALRYGTNIPDAWGVLTVTDAHARVCHVQVLEVPSSLKTLRLSVGSLPTVVGACTLTLELVYAQQRVVVREVVQVMPARSRWVTWATPLSALKPGVENKLTGKCELPPNYNPRTSTVVAWLYPDVSLPWVAPQYLLGLGGNRPSLAPLHPSTPVVTALGADRMTGARRELSIQDIHRWNYPALNWPTRPSDWSPRGRILAHAQPASRTPMSIEPARLPMVYQPNGIYISPDDTLQDRQADRPPIVFWAPLQLEAQNSLFLPLTFPDQAATWYLVTALLGEGGLVAYQVDSFNTRTPLAMHTVCPKFIRFGDQVEFAVEVENLGDARIDATVELLIKDPVRRQVIPAFAGLEAWPLVLPKGGSQSVRWTLRPSAQHALLEWEVVLKSTGYSTRESGQTQVALPEVPFTRTLAQLVKESNAYELSFDDLVKPGVTFEYKPRTFQLMVAGSPGWIAADLLPRLKQEGEYDTEQLFANFFSLAFTEALNDRNIRATQTLDFWSQTTDSTRLTDPRENYRHRLARWYRNPDLPIQTDVALQNLTAVPLTNGGLSWMNSMPDNRHLTQHILIMLGRLQLIQGQNWRMKEEVRRWVEPLLVNYLDQSMARDFSRLSEADIKKDRFALTELLVQYLFCRSYYPSIPIAEPNQTAYLFWIQQARRHWNHFRQQPLVLAQLTIALARHEKANKGSIDDARQPFQQLVVTLPSFVQATAKARTEPVVRQWYEETNTTAAAAIEAFIELGNPDAKVVQQLQNLVLQNPRTFNPDHPLTLMEAVWALLLPDRLILQQNRLADWQVNRQSLPTDADERELGFGVHFIDPKNILQSGNHVSMNQSGASQQWVVLHWQYTDLPTAGQQKSPIRITKQIWVGEKNQLRELKGNLTVARDEIIYFRIKIDTDQELEYLTLYDTHPAGFEPTLLTKKYNDTGGYFEATNRKASEFFLERLPVGTTIIEYPMKARYAGTYQLGMSRISCSYFTDPIYYVPTSTLVIK